MKIYIVLFFILFSCQYFGQINSYNKEFLINSKETEYMNYADLEVMNNGSFIVCWLQENYISPEKETEIYAVIFDLHGAILVDEFQVNSFESNFQDNPDVCVLENGNILFVWASEINQQWNREISAQLFTESGVKIGEEFRVNAYTESDQRRPCIASLTNERFAVVWESWGQDGDEVGIFCQIFNSSGIKIGKEFQVNNMTAGWQCEPTVQSLSGGEFLINYKSDDPDQPGYYYDFIQKYDSSGNKIGEKILLGNYPDYNSGSKTDLCELPSDEFAVARLTDDNLSIRIFTKNNDIRVNNNFEIGGRRFVTPSISNLKNGNLIVYWTSYDSSFTNSRIDTQIFDTYGNKIGGEFMLTKLESNSWSPPVAKVINDEMFLTVWTGRKSGNGIYGKYFLLEPIDHSLSDFEALNPKYDETKTTFPIDFNWSQASDIHLNFQWELSYDLYIADTFEFSDPLIFENIIDTSYQIDSLKKGETYFWKVLAKNISGDTIWSGNTNGFYLDDNATSLVWSEEVLPEELILYQNYPNPFNPSTVIQYQIPGTVDALSYIEVKVTLKIYDILGREITTLVDKKQNPGNYEVTWNPSARGVNLTSGIYIYELKYGEFMESRKMLLLK